MTLLAVEPVRLSLDPRRYVWCVTVELKPVCYAPGCAIHFGLHKHHIVRRSQTGGPLDYVTIDGLVTQNVVNLCRVHHEAVTGAVGGHSGWIRHLAGLGWVWYSPAPSGVPGAVTSKEGSWVPVGFLKGWGDDTHARQPEQRGGGV